MTLLAFGEVSYNQQFKPEKMNFIRITPETIIDMNDEIVDVRFPGVDLVVYNYFPELKTFKFRLKNTAYDDIFIRLENLVSGGYLKRVREEKRMSA